MINHLNLVYFIAAARELNFTRAAEKLYISQQALSSHIASLEKEVGLMLIERKAPMRLTCGGEIFYKYALQMEASYQAMMQELSDVKDEKRGKLALGISHTRGRLLLPKVLPALVEAYPQVEVQVLEGNTKELSEALMTGAVDLTVGPCPQENPDIEYIRLLSEDIVLAVSEELFFRYGKEERGRMKRELEETGRIACLKEVPFLLNKKGNISREIADVIFEEEEMKPHTLIETENIETLGEMCGRGIGAAFYPTSLLGALMAEERMDRLRLFSLAYPCTHMTLAIAYQKNRYLTAAMREMIQIMRKVTAESEKKDPQ